MTAATQYAIVVWSPASTCSGTQVWPVRLAHTTTDVYAGGTFVHSANAGASWLEDDLFDGTFRTYVVSGAQLLDSLTLAVTNIAPLDGLLNPLSVAQKNLSRGRISATCGNLEDFVAAAGAQSDKKLTTSGAQSDKKLPTSDANQFISDARHIEAVLGC